MYLSKIRSKHHLDLKMIFSVLFRAIFFPLFALWMLWKINMTSKKEILEELVRFRSHGDILYKDLNDVSTSALQIMAQIENRLRGSHAEEDQKLLKEIEQFADKAILAACHGSEYATSLLKDYGGAIKKIGDI